MSDVFLRLLNPPTEVDGAFPRLREGQGISRGDLLGNSDTVSHYEATDGDAGPATGPDVNDRFYVPETDSDTDPDVDGFYKLRIILDATMERALALPEFVLREEDAIVKATALRFVELTNHNNACFANMINELLC